MSLRRRRDRARADESALMRVAVAPERAGVADLALALRAVVARVDELAAEVDAIDRRARPYGDGDLSHGWPRR
jgi:hypothetical protein